MNTKTKTLSIAPLALSVALAMPTMFASSAANAEVSATLGAASMYLWRGQNLTPDGPQFSGSLDYSHGSGFYAGVWMTNEDAGHETDLYLGFGGEVGGLGYDVSYWKYLYPEDGTNVDLGDNDASEVAVSLSFGPVSAAAYIAVEDTSNEDVYYTLSAELDSFSLTYGIWDLEKPGNEYSHITASYAFNDNISFTVSKAMNDTPTGVEEDPLFMVSFSKSFDL